MRFFSACRGDFPALSCPTLHRQGKLHPPPTRLPNPIPKPIPSASHRLNTRRLPHHTAHGTCPCRGLPPLQTLRKRTIDVAQMRFATQCLQGERDALRPRLAGRFRRRFGRENQRGQNNQNRRRNRFVPHPCRRPRQILRLPVNPDKASPKPRTDHSRCPRTAKRV